ncbi:FAD-binding oxidoreductase [Pannonibacter sp. Pt2-lr]
MLQKKSAMMHMGRFVVGLAHAAARHGAEIHENTPVTGRRQTAAGHELETPKGIVRAAKVVLATGAYTPRTFSFFRRRIVPVGSFLLATRPLTDTEVQSVMPGNRTCVTSLNVGNYFRLAPDNRLIFGGRAPFPPPPTRPRTKERPHPQGRAQGHLPAARRYRGGLLLGRPRRHDQGPFPPRRRG